MTKRKVIFYSFHVLDWISATSIFSLLYCICVVGWNEITPTVNPTFQPEMLFIASLFLGGYGLDKFRDSEAFFIGLGVVFIWVGIAVLILGLPFGKLLLCVGAGPVFSAVLRRLWEQARSPVFFLFLACCISAGTLIAGLPMFLDSLYIWPYLTVLIGAGLVCGFIPHAKPKTHFPAAEGKQTLWGGKILFILFLLAESLPAICIGAVYKKLFTAEPPISALNTLLFCGGVLLVGYLAYRFQLVEFLKVQMAGMVVLLAMQLAAHADTPFAHGVSYFLMGVLLLAYILLPMLIWPKTTRAVTLSLGVCAAFIFLIVIPRTLNLVLPSYWLFSTKLGWVMQTSALLFQFAFFCLFAFYVAKPVNKTLKTLENVPSLPDSRQNLPLNLTKREQDVAAQVLQGKSRKDIAQSLGIAESTVKTHMYNLFAKANCRTKAEFIARYHQ